MARPRRSPTHPSVIRVPIDPQGYPFQPGTLVRVWGGRTLFVVSGDDNLRRVLLWGSVLGYEWATEESLTIQERL